MSPGEEEELVRKAEFCLATGIAPSEYDAMTEDELAVFIEVYNRKGSAHHG